MTKVKTETKEEKEAMDAIKPVLNRKQVVAKEKLQDAAKACERLGIAFELMFK